MSPEPSTKKLTPSDIAHQEAIQKLKENGGLVAAHSLGSGKTLLSLRAARELGGKSLFITPASLVSNVHKEEDKHNIHTGAEVLSYEKAVNDADRLRKKDYNLVVFDEAHKLRNADTQRAKVLADIASRAKHRLLLTATPSYNNPEDLGKLVNIAANKTVFPSDHKKFEEEFTQTRTVKPKLLDRILHGAKPYTVDETHIPKKYEPYLKKFVHKYDATATVSEHFPSIKEEKVHVPMSRRQEKLYDYYEGKLPGALKWKIRMGIPSDKREAARLNVFGNSLRQISNGTQAFSKEPEHEPLSPKITHAAERLHARYKSDKNFRGLVYSNFLKSGIEPYSAELKRRGIPHRVLTGSLSKAERQQIVNEYNTGKTPVMFISSAGAEGLDLKGTKLVQVMEPHFNKSKISQVVGRARRFKSHDHLPPSERHVEVEHYLSVKSPTMFNKHPDKTIDQYLSDMSEEKHEQTEKIMKKIPS
jgi:SNF2 family DNA or RNA helicase